MRNLNKYFLNILFFIIKHFLIKKLNYKYQLHILVFLKVFLINNIPNIIN